MLVGSGRDKVLEKIGSGIACKNRAGMVSCPKHSWKQGNGAAVLGRAATILSLPFGGLFELRRSNEVPFQNDFVFEPFRITSRLMRCGAKQTD